MELKHTKSLFRMLRDHQYDPQTNILEYINSHSNKTPTITK